MASSRTLEPGLWWYGKNNLVVFYLSLKTIRTRHFNGVNDEHLWQCAGMSSRTRDRHSPTYSSNSRRSAVRHSSRRVMRLSGRCRKTGGWRSNRCLTSCDPRRLWVRLLTMRRRDNKSRMTRQFWHTWLQLPAPNHTIRIWIRRWFLIFLAFRWSIRTFIFCVLKIWVECGQIQV